MRQQAFQVLVAADMRHQYTRNVAAGVGDFAQMTRRGQRPLVTSLCTPDSNWSGGLSRMSFDGLILVTQAIPGLEELRARHLPTVAYGRFSAPGRPWPAEVPWVACDDTAIGRLAAEFLSGCGVESFTHFRGRPFADTPERLAAFAARVAESGHRCIVPPYLVGADGEIDEHAARDWVAGLPKPVGILAYNDGQALKLQRLCDAAGVTIPNEVALLGVDNDEVICALALPTLSSVKAPHRQCGYLIAEMLYRRLCGEACGPGSLLVPPGGVAERESTATALARSPELMAAVRVIRERSAGHLDVAALARAASVSRRRLEELFRVRLRCSPAQAIRRQRVEHAKDLLRDSQLCLKAVAAACGPWNSRDLTRAFRAETGMSPSSWRHRCSESRG
jgi:LacI family transcriptional regulator